MAQVAVGTQSPCCGTFAAASGAKSDEQLVGACGTCGKAFAKPNPEYEPVLANRAEVGKYVATIVNDDKSLGTITVTGYGLDVAVENVHGLVKDAPTPDEAPQVGPRLVPVPASEFDAPADKSPDGSYSPENVTQPKAGNGE